MESNEKTNQFQNPGFAQTDFALKKTTNITERLNLELRGDFINAFNRPNLNGVDANAQAARTSVHRLRPRRRALSFWGRASLLSRRVLIEASFSGHSDA